MKDIAVYSIFHRVWLSRMALIAIVAVACFAEGLAFGQAKTKDGFRKLAPGVLKTIPRNLRLDDTVTTGDIVEITTVPNLEWPEQPYTVPKTQTVHALSKDVNFRQNLSELQLSFKPVRMIYVDLPQPDGTLKRKLIWYMVYKVTNLGGHYQPVKLADGSWGINKVDMPVRFMPLFVLRSHEYDKEYMDRLIPLAIPQIRKREDPARPLLNSVQMSYKRIPLSTKEQDNSVWGVATWEDIDSRIDFFSIYVHGLTNANRWIPIENGFKEGDKPGTGKRFLRKILQLNFWRPGDEFQETDKEIRFGTPDGRAKIYNVPEGVDYTWIYR